MLFKDFLFNLDFFYNGKDNAIKNLGESLCNGKLKSR